jgi:hypothetical protein
LVHDCAQRSQSVVSRGGRRLAKRAPRCAGAHAIASAAVERSPTVCREKLGSLPRASLCVAHLSRGQWLCSRRLTVPRSAVTASSWATARPQLAQRWGLGNVWGGAQPTCDVSALLCASCFMSFHPLLDGQLPASQPRPPPAASGPRSHRWACASRHAAIAPPSRISGRRTSQVVV